MKLVTVRAIVICQIVGGVLILVTDLFTLAQGVPDNLLYLFVYLVTSLGMATLAVVAGFTLWKQTPMGVRLSIIAQIIQLTWITIPRSQFGAILGAIAGFQLAISSVGDVYAAVNLGFYGKGGLLLLPADSHLQVPLSISVNLLAVLALARLWPMRHSQPMDNSGKLGMAL